MARKRIRNYDEPVEVAPGIHWVGFYDEKAQLHCNPYILIDKGGEAVVIDPGSVPHFPVVARKILSLVSPRQISTLILNHQDPDLCGAVPVFEDVIGTKSLRIAAHSRAAMLIKYYGLRSDFYIVDKHGCKLTLRSGRVLSFFQTPYLHSPSATATFDRKEKVLFSGDLFGAFSKDWALFAGPGYAERMKEFHEAYMPCSSIVRATLDEIEKLDLAMIAPQHGSIIRASLIKRHISAMRKFHYGKYIRHLPCRSL